MSLIFRAKQYTNFNLHHFWPWLFWPWYSYSEEKSKTSCSSWGHQHLVFHHRILKSLEIFELFIYHAFFPPSIFLFVFIVLCCDVFAVYYPQSDWYRVYILSLAHSREAHAQSSFNICSNPCSSCRLNGSYFWFPPVLLMLQFRHTLSHTHLSFQCKCFHFSMLEWLI